MTKQIKRKTTTGDIVSSRYRQHRIFGFVFSIHKHLVRFHVVVPNCFPNCFQVINLFSNECRHDFRNHTSSKHLSSSFRFVHKQTAFSFSFEGQWALRREHGQSNSIVQTLSTSQILDSSTLQLCQTFTSRRLCRNVDDAFK